MDRLPDYYAVIQVDPRAERDVIDAAYRRLAAKYHPDVDPSPGATERMKLINVAYDVLSDPEKRRAYDLRRGASSWRPRGGTQPSPQPSPKGVGADWTMSLVVTGLMLALSVAGPRFGIRAVLIVGLLFLGVWLLMSWRKS